MDKRVTLVLAVVITLALAGLVIVQAQWVRGTIQLRDAELGQELQRALLAVSDRMEQDEAEGLAGAEDMGEPWQGAVPEPDEHAFEEPFDGPGPLPDGPSSEHQQLFNDVLRGILNAGRHMEIGERVDERRLEELVREEVLRQGITAPILFGVLAPDGTVVLGDTGTVEEREALMNTEHRVRMFRHDPFAPAHWLVVHVPNQHRVVLRNLWPMLAASAVLVLLIGAAFVFTLHTISRQRKLNEIRNDLVNNLTHELKTPISTIALACEALNDPGIPKSPEQLRSFTGMIRDENKRLGVLVESVLQSAVVDSGRMKLRTVDLDMHALLADVVRNMSIQAGNRGGRIVLEAEAELYHVLGDRTHLTNVFHNLVDNAVKYCEREPQVVIRTSSDRSGFTVRVKDNGIGIPRAYQHKVFDSLYRVPTGNVHNVKGFGLGLSYVRSVLERHGGSVALDSEPGMGSIFTITIPYEHGRRDQTAPV